MFKPSHASLAGPPALLLVCLLYLCCAGIYQQSPRPASQLAPDARHIKIPAGMLYCLQSLYLPPAPHLDYFNRIVGPLAVGLDGVRNQPHCEQVPVVGKQGDVTAPIGS